LKNSPSLWRYLIVFGTLLFLSKGAEGQSMPVGTPFWEEALRRGQLLGHLDSNVSMMIRPVDPSAAFGMPLGWGYDSLWCPGPMLRSVRPQWDWRSDNYGSNRYQIHGWRGFVESCKEFRVQVLPVLIQVRYNEHHPYGWSDGPMVPSKGMQTYASAGAFVKAGPLEVQYRPEWVVARNEDFLNPPYRQSGLDNPERMGTKPYRELHAGQSYVKLRLGPISTGWSSENIWWGPGVRNSILMSNNAPGISHFTLHTNRPLRTPLGTFEGQMIAGNLRHSGYWPYDTNPDSIPSFPYTPSVSDLQWDSLRGTGTHSYINAMQLVWQPRGLSGLFLGVSRGVQVKGYPKNFGDYFRITYIEPLGAATSNSERSVLNRNQLISFTVRYLLPQSHAEFYAEWAKDDHWWDWEDFLTRPLATSAWLGGVRKIYPRPGNAWMQVWAEATVVQAPHENYMQSSYLGAPNFYTHANKVGWTHRGQVLGAGIGPGSNLATVGLEYGKGKSGIGLHWERLVHNEDLFFTRGPSLTATNNPFLRDYTKHFVDWGWQLNFFHSWRGITLTGRYNLLRTYNFQYRYDPEGSQGPLRWPGINVWSHNLDLSLLYRF
jgi:hypothetical protein